MPPRARPAARAPALRKRPASHVAGEEKVTRLHLFRELAAVQLRGLGLVELAQASYYEGHVKLAGFVEGLGKDDAFLTFRATGTQTDHMTELLADPQRRTFQLHVCEPSCGRRESGPDIIHAAGYWVVEDEEKKPWQTMYDEGPTKVGADDETGALRKLHEERKGADRREDKPPSEESEKKGKTKEKRKKKKQKEKLKKQEKEPGPKKGADIEEDSALLERGQKALSALYVGTCLDPDAETRSRLLKRAKRFGGRSSKKRRRSSSENTSSSSSSSETEEDEFGEGLFEERKRALRLTRRYPGSLAAQTVASMKESLLTQSGSLYAQDRKTLPPIFSQFYRSEMQALCSPSMSQELLTLSQGADLLLRGHPARALDLLAQRGHWTVARQLELVSADSVGLSKGPEGQEAAKLAKQAKGSKRVWKGTDEQRTQRALELEDKGTEAEAREETRAIERLLEDCREEGLRRKKTKDGEQQVGPRPHVELGREPQGSQTKDERSVALWESRGRDIVVRREDDAALGPPGDVDFLEGEQDSQSAGVGSEKQQGGLGDTASQTYTSPLKSGSRRMVLEASNRQAFEQCRYNLATACRKKGLRFEEIGEPLLEALKVQEKAYARCSETKGDLFPLPLPSSLKPDTPPGFCTDALVQALNSLYGTKTLTRVREDKVRLTMVERLEKVVGESELEKCELPDLDFGEFFKARSVDYSGEIVQVARRFDWRMVEAAFPEAVLGE
ncbi:unnamed protein product [Durusdinium trenchii]|uniref:Uncharacterized protein n=1 Tax=Durusdinium trenchii TaxID=1381693 RepID=A0ABP0KKT6_9DINO